MCDLLWTAAEIAAATGGRASADFDVTGLSIDTRSLKPGELFIALTDVRDGHDFAANAFKAGASGALVSRPVDGGPVIEVDDVLTGLEALGIAARQWADDCRRVAVTGSVGKTSVKEMLAQIFSARGPAHWNEKSFNNQWGVPLTLAKMPRQTRHAVFEIGMNSPGEIAPRSVMVAPHVGLITKIAAAHLEGVGSLEGVAQEKSDIFAGLLPGGTAVLPAEDDFLDFLSAKAQAHCSDARILTFGETSGADARITDLSSDGQRSSIGVTIHGRAVRATINAVGLHWAYNVAAALLAACPDPSDDAGAAAGALTNYAPPPGRGTLEALALADGGAAAMVDDAYNANPESMRAALSGFAARPCSGKRIVALGEMLEVGSGSVAEHARLADPVLASGAEAVFLAGEGMKALADRLSGKVQAVWAPAASGLESDIKLSLRNGDLLLLKGSNASGMGRLADHLRDWSKTSAGTVMDRGAEGVARGSDAV
ncbi:MAG: UDP-N-acetylmuramoyl-tripeptide--D-alanyl-D-alanine ligase [Pseudomonadota bacterium]